MAGIPYPSLRVISMRAIADAQGTRSRNDAIVLQYLWREAPRRLVSWIASWSIPPCSQCNVHALYSSLGESVSCQTEGAGNIAGMPLSAIVMSWMLGRA